MSAISGTRAALDDLAQCSRAFHIGAGDANQVRAGILAAADLVDRRPGSDVSVLVMVWTVIGASPPTGTVPTMIWRLLRRSISRHGSYRGHGFAYRRLA